MHLATLAAFSLVALSSAVAQTIDYKIYHRVFHPSTPNLLYKQRGVVTLAGSNSAEYTPSPSFSVDISSFATLLDSLDDADALYQIALEHEGDTAQSQWDVSSVKVCHLSPINSETLFLHLVGSRDPKPFALDYFVSPIPHNGLCPRKKSKRNKAKNDSVSPIHSFAANVDRLNTTIILRGPTTPPLPELHTPPPLTPEGEILKVAPEKTFLQKYWMYGFAIVLMLLVTGGGEEEQPRRAT